MPTPPVAQPVEQSQSMFAPPVEQTQPAINPVFQPPQTAGPVAPQPEMPMMQQPAPQPEMPSIQPPQQNQRDPQYIGMPDEMYASMIKDKQMNNGQGPIDNMVRPWQQWEYNQSQQQQNQRDPQYNGMPDDMYGRMMADQQREQEFAQQNPGMPMLRTSVIRDYEQWMNDQRSQPVAGPIAPTSTSY
jgi:hypothetical protein